jgi:hypothetical protein
LALPVAAQLRRWTPSLRLSQQTLSRHLMYEHRKQPLLSSTQFALRVGRHLILALFLLFLGLGVGILGYHFVGELGWVDSLLNASMILSGMGPVDLLRSSAAKIFASCYALFSGLAFLGVASLIVAPFAHRVLHDFHLDKE